MAHAYNYVASLEEELTCCICTELFIDPHTPKDLQCPHVICVICLGRIATAGNVIECPQCRVITTLSSSSGVAGLRTNLSLRNLAEKHHNYVGSDQLETVPENAGDVQDSSSGGGAVCAQHPTDETKLYCFTCDAFVCQQCSAAANHDKDNHDQHDVKDLELVRGENTKKLLLVIKKLEQASRSWERKAIKITDQERRIMSGIRTEEEKIDLAVTSAVAIARDQGNAFKTEIRAKHANTLWQCRGQTELMQKRLRRIGDAVDYARAVMSAPSCHDFLMQHRALGRKLDEMERADMPQTEDELSTQHNNEEEKEEKEKEEKVEFKADGMTVKIGVIHLKRGGYNAIPRSTAGLRRKLVFVADLRSFAGWVTSLASSKSGDILAISERKKVHIYRSKTDVGYAMHTKFKLPGDRYDTSHLAMASNGNLLVTKGSNILTFTTTGEFLGRMTSAIKGIKLVKLSCIATMPDGRIVVGDKGQSVIVVYSPEGTKLLKYFDTPIKPRNITAVGDSHVAISQYDAHKVCVVNLKSGTTTLQISVAGPMAVCYDVRTHSLLVATGELRMYGIMQYCAFTGALVSRIGHQPGALCNPWAITFLGDGMLAVADEQVVNLYKTSV